MSVEPNQPPAAPPNLIIQRFAGEWCPNCRVMKRNLTLEKWAGTHPNVRIEDYDLDNPAAEDKADEYGIEGVPAFVILDSEGHIVQLQEGAMNTAGLEKMYQKALKALEEGNLGVVPRRKRRRRA